MTSLDNVPKPIPLKVIEESQVKNRQVQSEQDHQELQRVQEVLALNERLKPYDLTYGDLITSTLFQLVFKTQEKFLTSTYTPLGRQEFLVPEDYRYGLYNLLQFWVKHFKLNKFLEEFCSPDFEYYVNDVSPSDHRFEGGVTFTIVISEKDSGR